MRSGSQNIIKCYFLLSRRFTVGLAGNIRTVYPVLQVPALCQALVPTTAVPPMRKGRATAPWCLSSSFSTQVLQVLRRVFPAACCIPVPSFQTLHILRRIVISHRLRHRNGALPRSIGQDRGCRSPRRLQNFLYSIQDGE